MRLRDWTLQYSLLWAAVQDIEGDCICPEGYESVGDECMKVSTLPTEQPPGFTPLQLVKYGYHRYSVFGTVIYDAGFNLDGTGSFTFYEDLPFWHNKGQSSTLGPMNRCSLWTETYYNYQQIGFAVCVNIPKDRTYLIGYGVDNHVTIRVDGMPVIQMIPQEVAATFNYWNVYPVSIRKGLHIIEIIAYNQTSIAAVGAEIYDATPQELMAIDNMQDLEAITVFSTRNMVGELTNLGTNGYPVVEGYALAICFGHPPFYRKVEYTDCLEE